MTIYILKHTIHTYEGSDVTVEAYTDLNKAKEELKKAYDYIKDDYDEINEEESYLEDMEAFILGDSGATYGEDDWDKLEIIETELN